jgi:hypothetical protein
MLAALSASAEEPLDAKKIVDAFVGSWSGTGTLTAPGAQPVRFPVALECKRAAGGRVANCVQSGTLPGEGAFEAILIIAVDDETRVVHFMGANSTGQADDHKCSWKSGKRLECEPLKRTQAGQPISVTMVADFLDPSTMSSRSVTTLAGGAKIVMEGVVKRR